MKKVINPPVLFNSRQYGFSQIVVSKPGKHVFISGQVAWDEHMNIVGRGDLAVQTQKAVDNLKIAVESAGGSLDDIVMLRIYKVDYQDKDGAVIEKALEPCFGTTRPPACTLLSVDRLANRDFLIEIEAQAIINSGE